MSNPRRLGFVEPGHFHAALTLRRANPSVHEEVHLYAAPGPERDAFQALVESFNARGEAPTRWRIRVHEHTDAVAALIHDRAVDAVVLAGRNVHKLEHAARLHAAGIPVLADKPWLTRIEQLDALAAVTRGPPLVMDIMTERYDVLARLRARLTGSEQVFGRFRVDDPEQPAIEIGSVHHLYKQVNNRALIRPAWYYDVGVQGDGLVDIQSHMVDQMQWLVGEPDAWLLERDVTRLAARRWCTRVDRALFRDSTGLEDFPDALAPWIENDVLELACNSEIRYSLRGVPVCQRAEWREREPAGGGDLHSARLAGTRSEIVLEHGAHTGYKGELRVLPRAGVDIASALEDAIAEGQAEFPGLGMERESDGFRLQIPDAIRSTHESHFPMVLDAFLDALDSDTWPAALAARIRMRYGLLASALQLVAT